MAARRRDPAAWEHIFSAFGPSITRYAASRGVTDPEDVTQEVMCAAVGQIHRFSGGWDNLRPWLFTIAYRRCADHFRRRHRSPERPTDRLPERVDIDEGADRLVCADGEAREALAALAILDERERDVVKLRIVDELGTRVVADALGLSRGNVRVILSRSLSKLRRHLETNGGYLDKRFRHVLASAIAIERGTSLGGVRARSRRFGTSVTNLFRPSLPLAQIASNNAASLLGGQIAATLAGVVLVAAVAGTSGGLPTHERSAADEMISVAPAEPIVASAAVAGRESVAAAGEPREPDDPHSVASVRPHAQDEALPGGGSVAFEGVDVLVDGQTLPSQAGWGDAVDVAGLITASSPSNEVGDEPLPHVKEAIAEPNVATDEKLVTSGTREQDATRSVPVERPVVVADEPSHDTEKAISTIEDALVGG